MPASRYESMTVVELREAARTKGISGVSKMKKSELVQALQDGGGGGRAKRSGGGGVRTGPKTSKSLKYAQEVTSPEEQEERPGKTLVTTDHDVIRAWAEKRGGRPATPKGRRGGGRARTLRFDFGSSDEGLEEISWDEWFRTFDERQLNFIYQEHRGDGSESNFFRLENPGREDG